MARIASNHLKYLEFGDSIKVTVKNENGREIEARGKLVSMVGGTIQLVGYSPHDMQSNIRLIKMSIAPGNGGSVEIYTTKIFGEKRRKIMEILKNIEKDKVKVKIKYKVGILFKLLYYRGR